MQELTLETALRLAVIGQELLIAAIFLAGSGSRSARISGALLLLSIAGYLINSDPVLRAAVPALLPLVVLLAIIVPYCLWLFARAVFEAPWRNSWLVAGFGAIALLSWVVFVFDFSVAVSLRSTANTVNHVTALIVVAHALWLTGKGRPDDLVEARRRFRLLFISLVAAQVTAVLVAEMLLGSAPPPGWLSLGNVLVIAGLTFGLAIPLLRPDPAFFAPAPGTVPSDVTPGDTTLRAAETVLEQKLMGAMKEGAYRETRLTIRALAERLGVPEHRLRRLINGHLGFRNFSAFLNSFRIAEAKSQLADPERVRLPVLTIALDLGYASLGPFNRAFKAMTGVTPTEYRQVAIRQKGAGIE